MARCALGLVVVACLAVLVIAGSARTEEKADDGGMAAWMALGTPGPEHAWLGKLVGSWDVEVRMFQGPGEPATSHGTATITSKWGGRYLDMRYQGEFEGNAFEGQGTWAYNNGAKRYEGSWIDSFSTALAVTTGQRSGDELTSKGTVFGPQGEMATRDVVKVEGPDRWTMTGYWSTPQGEAKVMELVYTRADSGK